MTGARPLERVACALCGRPDDEPVFEKDGFQVVRCLDCGLVYVNPRLTMAALAALYNDQEISPVSYYVRTEREDERSFASRLRLIERYRPPGALLDLGCGPGTFSRVARTRGWRTKGVDLNAASIAHCRAAGLDVVCDGFPTAALAGETYDLVVMNDFLEHLPDPVGVLAAARHLLAPGGIVFITTPDIGAMVARVAGKRWLHLKPNEHLLYFDRRSITALLLRGGFRIECLQSIGRVRNLAVALEKIAAYGRWPSRIARMLVPDGLAKRVNLPVNLGDEMAVVARRD